MQRTHAYTSSIVVGNPCLSVKYAYISTTIYPVLSLMFLLMRYFEQLGSGHVKAIGTLGLATRGAASLWNNNAIRPIIIIHNIIQSILNSHSLA